MVESIYNESLCFLFIFPFPSIPIQLKYFCNGRLFHIPTIIKQSMRIKHLIVLSTFDISKILFLLKWRIANYSTKCNPKSFIMLPTGQAALVSNATIITTNESVNKRINSDKMDQTIEYSQCHISINLWVQF